MAPRRGDPNSRDYPMDGRKSAVAVHGLIGQLLTAGHFFPTTAEIKAVVNRHVLTQVQPTYRESNRQRLRGGIQRYFRFFGCPAECRLIGADFLAAEVRLHLVWERPDDAVLVDELIADLRAGPGMGGVEARLDDVFGAASSCFADRLTGVRVCVFGAPASSLFIGPDGVQRDLSSVTTP